MNAHQFDFGCVITLIVVFLSDALDEKASLISRLGGSYQHAKSLRAPQDEYLFSTTILLEEIHTNTTIRVLTQPISN